MIVHCSGKESLSAVERAMSKLGFLTTADVVRIAHPYLFKTRHASHYYYVVVCLMFDALGKLMFDWFFWGWSYPLASGAIPSCRPAMPQRCPNTKVPNQVFCFDSPSHAAYSGCLSHLQLCHAIQRFYYSTFLTALWTFDNSLLLITSTKRSAFQGSFVKLKHLNIIDHCISSWIDFLHLRDRSAAWFFDPSERTLLSVRARTRPFVYSAI